MVLVFYSSLAFALHLLSLSLSFSLGWSLYWLCIGWFSNTHTLYLSIYLYLYRHFFGGKVVYEKPLNDVFTVKLYMMLA
ncbi:hypothetical protein E1A91_D05G260700v1 [Gossypium mustelinum]|uniref:Uncharacterized protein n=1 Tax=Gossypium mustelinum TaxID=34275 RepID=A0A5D2V102_GOSMU|nr:hypothetical protein E1A91_D05G260700v1 [Gossypium mustelinum]